MFVKNIDYIILLNLLFIVVLITSEYIFPKIENEKNKEYLRKLVHFETAILFIVATFLLNQEFFIILVTESLISVIASKYLHIFHALNDSRRKKANWGGIFFSIALIIISLLFYNNTFLIREALFITGISDSLAAFAGMNIPVKEYNILNDNKSYMGSFIFLVTSSFIFLGSNIGLLVSIILSLILTITEAISYNGSDNFTLLLITPFILIAGELNDLIILVAFVVIFILLYLFPLKKYNI
jgi:dolichol kinase